MATYVPSEDRTIERPFLTTAQRELLRTVLDLIIPADGDLPSAGALGLQAFLENVASRTAARRRLLNDGLAQIALAASGRAEGSLELQPDDEQDATLRRVEQQNPVFFDFLVRQCYNGYYTNPDVQTLVGDHRPSPSEYVYQPLDENLLEPQRQRPPFWTQV